MPSILPGYEYDIFISYRHNDNRSGWVTEFVKHLQEELAATIKEKVTLYFDSNPHDGLLETHIVDKSLEGKLKCLVFIPILSQTYCDPQSFAWQKEFCAFNRLANEGPIGRDIKLRNGNVASRILIVKTHDLDEEDQSAFQKETGAIARSIDFIYESMGVNRPLTPTDNPDKNLNHAFYRDQINKVARSVKDLIYAMKDPDRPPVLETKPSNSPYVAPPPKKRFPFIVIAVIVAGLLSLLIYYFVGRSAIADQVIDRSIAVIPFKLIGDDQEGKYFAEGVADALMNHLHTIPNLKVRSRTSVEKYFGSLQTIPEIGNELNVQYILEGSAQKYKNHIRIIVQLINTKTDEHVWHNEYDEDFENIFKIQSEIALNIASELNIKLASSQRQRVEKLPTKNPEAWDAYLRGMEYNKNFWKHQDEANLKIATQFYKKAIQLDPEFALAYLRLSDVSWMIPKDSILLLITKSIELDPDLPDSYEQLGNFYAGQDNPEKAVENLNKAVELNPLQNYILSLGKFYSSHGDQIKALSCYNDAFQKERSDFYQWLLYETSRSYLRVDELVLAERFIDAGLQLEPDNISFLSLKSQIQMLGGNLQGMLQTVNRSVSIDHGWIALNLGAVYFLMGDYDKSAKTYGDFFSNDNHIGHISDKIWYAFVMRKLGKEKTANEIMAAVKKDLEQNTGENDNFRANEHKYFQAKVDVFYGEKSKALSFLDQYKPRLTSQYWIDKDPVFESLKDEPRFKKAVNRISEEFDVIRKQTQSKIANGEFPTPSLIGEK
ncbi:MAG: tetratricopeptide repeat protein [Chryseolinea sp.]